MQKIKKKQKQKQKQKCLQNRTIHILTYIHPHNNNTYVHYPLRSCTLYVFIRACTLLCTNGRGCLIVWLVRECLGMFLPLFVLVSVGVGKGPNGCFLLDFIVKYTTV